MGILVWQQARKVALRLRVVVSCARHGNKVVVARVLWLMWLGTVAGAATVAVSASRLKPYSALLPNLNLTEVVAI